MGLLQLIVLAIIQGITEFLPVSSSAHLILAPVVLGTQDQGPLIDLMAHGGSLLAVIAYYRKDVGAVLLGMGDSLKGRFSSPNARLFGLLAIATPPGVLAGAALFLSGQADALRDPKIIAAASLFFALPLWAADRWAREQGSVETRGWKAALMIGLAQVLAFIPGTSRSGITMTAARALGVTRLEAARFSMLMSIPLLGALALAAGMELYLKGSGTGTGLADGLIVLVLSAVVAYGAIAIFMRLVERIGLLPFALYRIVLSVVILLVLA
jgi:undecaprenyl-diphosphatase